MSTQISTINGSQPSGYDRTVDLKAFDERKTGVKGLVDEGLGKIPKIFIRPAEETSKEFVTCDEELDVPVIDLGSIDKQDVISNILSAADEWGFFQLVNHGIPLEVLDQVIEGVRMFHEQVDHVKQEIYSRDLSKQVRYNSNLDLYKSGAANWRDTLYVTTAYIPQLDPQLLPSICRDATLAYLDQVTKLAQRLLELISVGLGLKPDHLQELECAKAWNLVGHYYPPCPEPNLTLGTSKHSDPSFLTILLQDQIGGLQVLHQNQWVKVKPVHGALVVNIGDLLQMVTNDKCKSVFHRVTANKVGTRISVATFFVPPVQSSRTYGPIKELLSEENPAIYKEFTVQECLGRFYSRAVDQPVTDFFRQTA